MSGVPTLVHLVSKYYFFSELYNFSYFPDLPQLDPNKCGNSHVQSEDLHLQHIIHVADLQRITVKMTFM